MSTSEFSIIKEFFTLESADGHPPVVGVGDDCAILDVPANKQLAVSTDTLVEGVHFLSNSSPELLGQKVLAVNLSDLAAMGATPAWVSLAITMPEIDKAWLSSFSKGFFSLANKHQLHLIGGDTTRGPLSITINIMGLLPTKQRLLRSGAQVGDQIFVSGSIGSAGLGLKKASSGGADLSDADISAYLNPVPRVDLGQCLLNVATSCIDISDGLSADLNHILKASGVGATLIHEKLPVTMSVRNHCKEIDDELWPYATGDDYELCFTLPKSMRVDELYGLTPACVTKIGEIEEVIGLRIQMPDGKQVELNKGFDHFYVD